MRIHSLAGIPRSSIPLREARSYSKYLGQGPYKDNSSLRVFKCLSEMREREETSADRWLSRDKAIQVMNKRGNVLVKSNGAL